MKTERSSTQSARACAICGGRLGSVVLAHARPDRFEKSVGIPESPYKRCWVRCHQCGSATNCHDPQWAERMEAIGASYYEIDFQGSDIRSKYERVMSLPPEQSDNAGRVARVLAFLDSWRDPSSETAVSVLDIGAGTGVFLARLTAQESFRWEAVGVEPDPRAAEHLRSLDRFKVVEGLFTGQSSFKNFDLVSLNKVVEHIPDPASIVKNAARAAHPERGVVYVEVPDVMGIGRRPLTDNMFGALHHHLYSIAGLDTLIRAAQLITLDLGRLVEASGKLSLFAFACHASAYDAWASNRE